MRCNSVKRYLAPFEASDEEKASRPKTAIDLDRIAEKAKPYSRFEREVEWLDAIFEAIESMPDKDIDGRL
jgi:hypothetical protein